MWLARGNYLTFLGEAPAESVATLSFPPLLAKGRKLLQGLSMNLDVQIKSSMSATILFMIHFIIYA